MIALAFPGQGSQTVGMGRDLCARHDTARFTYDEASRALGWDVAAVSFEGPASELTRTEITQPALLTHSIATLRVLEEQGLKWDLALGHSLGEYSALVATEALGFEDALLLVAARGREMAAAARRSPGAMVAVLGLEAEAVEALCEPIAEAWPANFNGPGQVVVSGTETGIAEVCDRAPAAGARKTVRLAVAGGFHSPLMQSAADALSEPLQATPFSVPIQPFLSTCSVDYEVEDLPELLARQIVSPVRFEQAVRRLAGEGYNAFLEVGPGAVLGGLVRRIDAGLATASAGDPASVEAALQRHWLETKGETI
jgi:[acyl-carrier-protein] S-malonyltransferase